MRPCCGARSLSSFSFTAPPARSRRPPHVDPREPGGGKNWDYRFAWVRDLAYTVRALICFGLREETHAAVSWLLTTIRELGPELHIFYALDGSVPEGISHPDVPGRHDIGPVVVGNGRQGQLQLGVYGDLFDVVHA